MSFLVAPAATASRWRVSPAFYHAYPGGDECRALPTRPWRRCVVCAVLRNPENQGSTPRRRERQRAAPCRNAAQRHVAREGSDSRCLRAACIACRLGLAWLIIYTACSTVTALPIHLLSTLKKQRSHRGITHLPPRRSLPGRHSSRPPNTLVGVVFANRRPVDDAIASPVASREAILCSAAPRRPRHIVIFFAARRRFARVASSFFITPRDAGVSLPN